MLDADKAKLTQFGSVKVLSHGRIEVDGFEGDGCTCRDVAALAMLWAIGELQRDLMATLESPDGGNSVIG